MKHHIQKQQFILTIRQGIDAFAVQHAASRFLQQGLLPILERIFDELSGEDEVIRLDHCVIDLGVIPEAVLNGGVMDESMYRLLKAEFRAAIDKELSLRPQARTRVRESVLQRWWYYMEHGRLPWNADGFSEDDQRRVLELFSVDFAQITRLRKALVEGSVLLARIAAQHSEWFLENLVTVLVSSRQVGLGETVTRASEAHRLLERIYREWTYETTHGPTPDLLQQREIWESLSGWASRMAAFRQAPVHEKKTILWQRLLVLAVQHRDRFVREGGVRLLLRDIPDSLMEILAADPGLREGEGPFVKAIYDAAERRHREMPGQEKKAEDIRHQEYKEDRTKRGVDEETQRTSGEQDRPGKEPPGGQTGMREKKDADHGFEKGMTGKLPDEKTGASMPAGVEAGGGKEAGIASEPSAGETDGQTGADSREGEAFSSALPGETMAPEGDRAVPPATSGPSREDALFKREEVTEEGIYLANAGLVLVHPFLPTLFHRLGLWDGAGFASFEARQKAIFLLHFLGTGERSAPEYVLVFPKMLCGYALEMPLPAEMALTDEECEEAKVLLENVVLRWDKLGKTSPEGLREGFLQRRGKLFDKGGRLCLLMESSALDVLLDYLPWNIHLVKLPWLKDILYVDWR